MSIIFILLVTLCIVIIVQVKNKEFVAVATVVLLIMSCIISFSEIFLKSKYHERALNKMHIIFNNLLIEIPVWFAIGVSMYQLNSDGIIQQSQTNYFGLILFISAITLFKFIFTTIQDCSDFNKI